MATASERLALVITANGSQAVTELTKVGTTARTQLGAAEKSMDRIGTGMVNAGAKVAAGGAVAVTAMFAAANAAQGLADSIGKAEDVFGSSVNLTAYSERAAESMALSKEAALDAASAYGLLLKQSGVGGSALALASTSLAERTADLAEKFKKPYAEVQKAIEAVIKTGSAKSLKGLLGVGIEIDPASLAGLDTAAKTTKVYEEILRQTADAQNTVKNSGDDIGVRAAVAQAKLDNAIAEIGEAATPVMIKMADAASAVVGVVERLPAPLKEILGAGAAIAAIGATLGGAASVLGGGLLKAIPGLKGFAAGMEGASGIAGKLGAGLGAVNLPAAALTATVVGGIAVYDAWARNADRVDAEMASLSATITSVASGAEVLPALAAQFNEILASRGGGQDAFRKTGLSVADVVNAVSAAPGAMDEFRDSVDGLGGSLEYLGTFAESFRGGGLEGIREQAEKAPPAVRALITELADLYEAGGISAHELRLVVDYMTDLDRAARASSMGVADQAKAMLDVAPAAVRGAEAWALYQTAVDETAGATAQADALAKLKALLPEAAAAASLAAGGIGALGDASADSATDVFSLATALQHLRAGAEGALGEVAAGVQGVQSAMSSVKSAQDRVRSAEKAYADLTTKDAKTIESAYERVISARERLNDLLRGDGNNLEQESPEAQLARARARLAEANVKLAANPGDAGAMTAKDEALADIDRAIQRRQETIRSADEMARQVRDAERNLTEAQEAYQEAIKPPDPAEVAAAQQAIDDAKVAAATSLLEFGQGVLDGKVSVDAYADYLDSLVSSGIISPESAAGLKSNLDNLTLQAGLAAAKLGEVAQTTVAPPPKSFAQQWAEWFPAVPQTTSVPSGMIWGPGGAPTVMGGYRVTGGRASGGHFGPGAYLVGENGPEIATFGTSGYVVNATRTAGIRGASGGDSTLFRDLHITEAKDARETGRQVVNRLRLRQLTRTG